MFTLVFCYIFNCLISFALIYSHDRAELWGTDDPPILKMPKLKDLQLTEKEKLDKNDAIEEWERKERKNHYTDSDNETKREEYVKNTISPAYHYFILRNEIEKQQEDSNSYDFFYIVLLLPTILTCCLIRLEIFSYAIISFMISLAVTFLSYTVINLMYKKCRIFQKMRIRHFNYEEDYYKAISNGETDFNNNVIEAHYNYLYSIKDSVSFRHCIRKLLSGIGIVLYVLFFFNSDIY